MSIYNSYIYIYPLPNDILDDTSDTQASAPSDGFSLNEDAVDSFEDTSIDVTDLESRYAKLDMLEISMPFSHPSFPAVEPTLGAMDASSLESDSRFSEIVEAISRAPLTHRRKFVMLTFAKLTGSSPKQVQQLCQWRDSILAELRNKAA